MHCGVCVDAACDQHRQRLARKLVDDVQQLQRPHVGGLVELKIERPHMVGSLCAQPLGGDRRLAEPPELASALRDAQPLLTPQALHPLAIHLPAQLAQPMVRATVPPRGRSSENFRIAPRNAASSSARLGSRRCVERC